MKDAVPSPEDRYFHRLLAWRRIRVMLATCLLVGLLMSITWKATYGILISRLLIAGLIVLGTFTLLERWPAQLPRWIARWALQVIGVAVTVPFAVAITYALTTIGEQPVWFMSATRMSGYNVMTGLGVLIVPWVAISALLQKIRGEAQRQALAFELERSEYERNALNARLHLLQAQVEPHFLFNTLANVRELVDAQSPLASNVLASLITYLRAAVPRLNDPATTLQQELDLVRAYLEVMHMRMPDRLQFLLHADDSVLALHCPTMTLLTLVENAVRHGIDPGEEGGRIEVRVQLLHGRCRAQVIDTGVGLKSTSAGLGTGLSNLRERLQLAFAGDAELRLLPIQPHGVCAEVEFPARSSP